MKNSDRRETLRIVVEQIDADESVREFHVNFELTSLVCQYISRNEATTEVEFSPLAEALVELPGVVSVIVRPYSVHVIKGRAFDWPQITQAVEELLIWVGKTFGVRQNPNQNVSLCPHSRQSISDLRG